MKDYLKYSTEIFLYFPLAYIGFLSGSATSIFVILLMVASQVLIDNFTSDDNYNPTVRVPVLLDLLLVAHLPAGIVALVLMVWAVSPGDMWGIGHMATTVLPFLHVKPPAAEIGSFDIVSAGTLAGFILSGSTIAAHELIHRRSSPVLLWVGRTLLGLNGDAQFAIAHVYGHHRNVATAEDPATARRGENLYRFFIRSTVGQYHESVELEGQRLQRIGASFFSIKNQFLSGLLLTMVVAAICTGLASLAGLCAYVICVVYAKFMLENVNYIQHYGLLRAGPKVEPRHSWDCMGRACTNSFYALSRHSHHHEKPIHPFWELHTTAAHAGVNLKWGYMGAMILAMIPPLWFRQTSPILAMLDSQCNDPAEQRLIHAANCQSGLPELVMTTQAAVPE